MAQRKGFRDNCSYDLLLSSPVCWKSLKICQFLIQSYEYIKEDGGRTLHDQLRKKAFRSRLWHPEKTWKAVLGDEHFSILTTFKQNLLHVNPTSVLDLHKVIRNKYVHTKEFTDAEKEKLKWFVRNGNNWVLDTNKWSSYWVSRFPRLVPFLWDNLKWFRKSDKLSKFYPSYLSPDLQYLQIFATDFRKTQEVLYINELNAGFVDDRYELKTESRDFILEFKTLPLEVLSEVLDKNAAFIITVHKGKILIDWNGASAETIEYCFDEPSMAREPDNFAIAVANSITDFDLLYFAVYFQSEPLIKKLIIFTREKTVADSNVQHKRTMFLIRLKLLFHAEFCEKPVNWLELKGFSKKLILNEAFSYQFEETDFGFKRTMTLAAALENSSDPTFNNESLASLQGNMLNKLIRNEKPVLFGKQKMPRMDPDYITRPLKLESCLDSNLPSCQDHILLFEVHNGLKTTHRIIFISDKPGMGKSLVLSSLAFQSCLTLQLKYHIKVFTTAVKFVEQMADSDLSKSLVNSVISQFVCCSNFEEVLLLSMLENNLGVEIFLDGLDEIKAELKEFALEILEFIKGQMPNIRVWVTTRDHMITERVKLLACVIYSIKPYTKDDQIDLMVQYWIRKSRLCYGVVSEKVKSQLSNFARNLLEIPESRFHTFMSGSPLLSRMLAEVHELSVTSEGPLELNCLVPVTIADVFEKSIDKKLVSYIGKFENCLTNKSLFYIIRDQLENYHMYFALKLILGSSVANNFKNQLLITAGNHSRVDSVVLEQGIIVALEPTITFIHRTFAEYFVAKFIWKVLTKEFLVIKEKDKAFQDILNNHVFQSYPTKKDKTSRISYVEFRLLDFWHFLDDFNEANNDNKLSLPENFPDLVAATTKFLLLQNRNVLSMNSFYYYGPLFGAISIEKCFGMLQIFLRSDKHLRDLFICSLVSGHCDFSKYLVQSGVGFAPEQWGKFKNSSKNKYGLLHWVIKGLCEIITASDSVIVGVEKLATYILETDKGQIELKDANGSTPLLLLMKESTKYGHTFASIHILHWLLRNGADINATDNDNNTILHVACDELTEEFPFYDEHLTHLAVSYFDQWEVFKEVDAKFQKLINAVNNEGNTPLLSAIYFFGENLTNELFRFKELGADFNAKDKSGDTAVHLAVVIFFDTDFLKMLVDLGADIFIRNGQGMNALHLAVGSENIPVAEMLIKRFRADVTTKDSSGKSVLDYDTSQDMQKMLISLKARCKKRKKKGSKIKEASPF